MLPTFVIGLREGLEAALIVGIIAAFLRKHGRRDLLVAVLAGVASAIALCVLVGIALELYARDLPQRQQEGLETVIGACAVGMVTYMVVWMRRHSRELKGQLEGMAAEALCGATPAGRAMVLMAFLAVIREGLETVVFLLAAFNEAGSGPAAGTGALLGIAVAIALGYGIYRGGVRLNLSKFFRATGLVLVLVAAGLVVNALHTAHEAGWLDAGQGSTVDLSWLVQPGTVQASLLTGMLGIQSHPVVIEVIGWLVYLVPVGCYVAWPSGKAVPARAAARASAWAGLVLGATATVLAIAAPDRPDVRPATAADGIRASVVTRSADHAIVETQDRRPVDGTAGAVRRFRLGSVDAVRHAGVLTDVYRARMSGVPSSSRPARLSVGAVAALNGGRLPIGIGADSGTVVATYRDTRTLTAWIDERTLRVVDVVWTERVTAAVQRGGRTFPLDTPVASARYVPRADAVHAAAAAARSDSATLDRRIWLNDLAIGSAVGAVLALLAALGCVLAARRQQLPVVASVSSPIGELVRS